MVATQMDLLSVVNSRAVERRSVRIQITLRPSEVALLREYAQEAKIPAGTLASKLLGQLLVPTPMPPPPAALPKLPEPPPAPVSPAEAQRIRQQMTLQLLTPLGRRPKGGWTDEEGQAATRILGRLSERSGVQYGSKGGEAHMRLVVSRLREGRSERDLRAIVWYCAVELDWVNQILPNGQPMRIWLRPETLFGPRTIDRYLAPALAAVERLEIPMRATS